MPNEKNENLDLKKYLLGSSENSEQEKIEERLMTDDDFFEQFLASEEDLIQDYVDEDLTNDEKTRFETHFLISEERQKKVEFARTLRRNIDARSASEEAKETPEKETETKPPLNFFQRLFASPLPVAASLLVIFGLSSFLVWNFYLRSNDNEIALASLNKAYKTERPLESRITGLDYAPLKNTRGGDDSKIDTIELDRAKNLSLKAASENPTAESFHSIGRFYLTQKEFDKAIEQLEKAEKLDANNAQIQNDLGVAYLEKAKTLDKNIGKRLELNSKALDSFENSIRVNPESLTPKFNRAVVLQIYTPRQAKKAWKEYLKVDSNSKWAEEARENLKKLESQDQKELSANQLEQKFLEAYRQQDAEKVFEIISQNREIIKEKYVPQRLAMSFVEASESERGEYLKALTYLGQLEKSRLKDNFAYDLANYYKNVSESDIKILRKAQTSMKQGYSYCLDNKFDKALVEFEKAREAFLTAENAIEPNSITDIFISYCLIYTSVKKKFYQQTLEVHNFTIKHKYRWLNNYNLFWLTDAEESIATKSKTSIYKELKKGYLEAQEMGDSYLSQKFLLSLAQASHFFKQESETDSYLHQLLKTTTSSRTSILQMVRNFNLGNEILGITSQKALPKAVVLEGLSFAEETKNDFYLINAQINCGTVFTNTGELDEAEKWLNIARINTEKKIKTDIRDLFFAKIYYRVGNIERLRGNNKNAVDNYGKASALLKNSLPVLKYEAEKSRLITLQDLGGHDQEVEQYLPEVIRSVEKNRQEILSEQERNSFFDKEQTIYDVAIEHEFRKGNNKKAFNYAETSSSRSLLDWLQRGNKVSIDKESSEVVFTNSTNPLEISDIQTKMPESVQIIQYAVLEKRILIWVISKENLSLTESKIESITLNNVISNYLNLIKSNNNSDQIEIERLAQELFGILVKPIMPLLDEKKEICIVPNKFLFNLPFASLMASDGNFFISKFTIFYSPSSNVFLLSTKKAEGKHSSNNENLLSIGNAQFDQKEFSDLQDLPSADKEAQKVSTFYNLSKTLKGKDATKRDFQAFSKNSDVIHFAGHYLVKYGLPLSSGLLLAKDDNDEENGLLTNAELIGEKFTKTKLIVLSACQSGVEGYYKGEGLIGLSRTFLAAGIPIIVGSQWKVDSEATAELMTKFHQYRRQKKVSTNKALRLAQLEMLTSSTSKFHSPYYWAAFGVFGGYAEY